MDFAVSSEPFRSVMILRRFNTWFSVQDGLWDDPNTWISNALDKKKITSPQPGDNVWINNTVTTTANIAYTVNNIYGNGTLVLQTTSILNVNGDLQITGTVDQSINGSILVLNGYNNSITNYSSNTSVMFYNGFYNQTIMPLTYGSLTTNNNGKKTLLANTLVKSNLVVRTNLECSTFDLTVNGATHINNANIGVFSKSGAGSLLFIGNFEGDASFSTIDFSGGNPNVEFRGGLSMTSFVFNTGSGTFSFTTNNQSISQNGLGTTWNAPISIVGAITLTVSGSLPLVIPTTINGTTGSSTLTIGTRLYLGTTTTPMATGVFNYMPTSSAMVGYVMNGNFTLPYTTFAGLYIGGTGIKTLLGSTTLSGNLVVNNSLECSTFDLTVNGTTTVQNGSTGTFSKSGAGSLLFVGLFDGVVNPLFSKIDWSAGNPSVEFRGGLNAQSVVFNTGTGTFTFSTNNQTINIISNGSGGWTAPILISGAITVTNIGALIGLITTGVLNGSGATSIFINNGGFTYNNAIAPMVTGKLYCNQAANTFVYGLGGGQDIQPPVDPVSPGYYNLTLQGSGAKKLLGNVSVKQVYTLTAPATLNSNGFALTNP